MSGNHPVRRVPPGRHPNWCRCPGCRSDIARHESGLLKSGLIAVAAAAVIAGLLWTVTAPLRIWHKAGPGGQMHPVAATWTAYGISGGVILLALMFFSVRSANRRKPVKQPVTVSQLRPPPSSVSVPAPPLCMHFGAVKVPDLYGNVLHCWCPGCEAELPPNWRLLCCGTEPETPHAYNCPQGRKETAR